MLDPFDSISRKIVDFQKMIRIRMRLLKDKKKTKNCIDGRIDVVIQFPPRARYV